MTDFSTPRRMSPGAFVIMFIKSFREIVGTAFVAAGYLLYKRDDSGLRLFLGVAIAIGVILAWATVLTFIRYYFRKFHIDSDKLIYTSGFAAKQTTSIPLSRVHTLRTKSGLFYRLLGMRGITFDTLASDKEEIELILDEHDWHMLLDRVKRGENCATVTDDTIPPPLPVEENIRTVSNSNILKGALCQNHLKGFAILGAAALAVYDKLNQIYEDTATRVIGYIDAHSGDILPSAWECIYFFVSIYLVVMLLWIGKIALRYGDMTILFSNKRLIIESGLVSRFTCRLACEKTTVLKIKQNPVEKTVGCQTITLRQAANATDNKKEGGIRIYGSNFGSELLTWWLGDTEDSNHANVMDAKSGKGLLMRRFIPHLIVAATGAAIIISTTQFLLPAVILSTVYAGVASVRAVMAWKHSRIDLKESYVRINGGNIAQISEYTRYSDIETVSISGTPFTKYTQRVSLRLSTNAGTTTVYSLLKDDALAIRNYILVKIATEKTPSHLRNLEKTKIKEETMPPPFLHTVR